MFQNCKTGLQEMELWMVLESLFHRKFCNAYSKDKIGNGKIRVYPINFPEYLVKDDLGKKRGILKVTATLCFKFLPIKNNQLSYNPIHMAFSIFKNHSADDIMKAR